MGRRSPAFPCILLLAIVVTGSSTSLVARADQSYVKYKDPKQQIQERVSDLVGRMTLEEKIGQMSQIERANASSSVIQKYFVGSSPFAPSRISLHFSQSITAARRFCLTCVHAWM